MSLKLFALIMVCVALSTLSQLLMKIGVSGTALQAQFAQGLRPELLFALARSGEIVTGVALYAVAAGLWLLVLSQADLSLAYPFIGLGFILIMLLSWLVLNENLNGDRVLGTILISVGVAFVARS